ncbi:MAG: hypothetical protein Kow0047_00170 [Anaerolineae bacterium]
MKTRTRSFRWWGISLFIVIAMVLTWTGTWAAGPVPPSRLSALGIAAAASCQELVTNGGFELSTGWTMPTTPAPATYTTATAHSGSRSVRLGLTPPTTGEPAVASFSHANLLGEVAPAGAAYSTAYQMITIPSDADQVLLTYWYKPGTEATSGDWQRVMLLTTSYTVLKDLTGTELSGTNKWTFRSFDLTAYKGRTVVLYFEVYNNSTGSTGRTWMYVDDVSVQACPETPTLPPVLLDLGCYDGTQPTGGYVDVTKSFNSSELSVIAGRSAYLSFEVTTDADGSLTHVWIDDVSLDVQPGGEQVVNGGFETGDYTGWEIYGAVLLPDLINDPAFVRSGSYAAWLGGYANAEDWIRQDITFPASPTSVDLAYSYYVASDETGVGDDQLCVRLRASDGLPVPTPPPVVAPSSIDVSGPSSGVAGVPYEFMATVNPSDVTVPLTYTWEATEQAPIVHSGGITDTVSFAWASGGTKTITVTAENSAGSVVGTHVIEILVPPGSVSITGPDWVATGASATFTATVSPAGVTQPITYTWEATDLAPVVHSGGTIDTVDLSWASPGTKWITVTAENAAGSVMDVFTTTVETVVIPDVYLFVEPITHTMPVGACADLAIQLDAGDHAIDAVDVHLAFDPNFLQVVGGDCSTPATQVTPGADLPTVLQNEVDNTAGDIRLGLGRQLGGSAPTGLIALGQFKVKGVQATGAEGTPIDFADGTGVYSGESSLVADTQGSIITVTETTGFDLIGLVTLQGRGDPPSAAWDGYSLTVKLYPSSGGTTVVPIVETTSIDASGTFTVTGLDPDIYDVYVKGSHSLTNYRTGIDLTAGPQTVDFGTLLEGDANDDDYVLGADFSILATSYGRCVGDPGFDPRADFNGSDCVDGADFALLASNYGQHGPVLISGGAGPLAGPVTLSIDPLRAMIAPDAVVPVSIVVRAGSQPIDVVDVVFQFDPATVQIVDSSGQPVNQLMPTGVLPTLLLNAVDNAAGAVSFSAGRDLDGSAPDGDLVLGTFFVKNVATALPTSAQLVLGPLTGVYYGGQSVLGEAMDGQIYIAAGAPTYLWLPSLAR